MIAARLDPPPANPSPQARATASPGGRAATPAKGRPAEDAAPFVLPDEDRAGPRATAKPSRPALASRPEADPANTREPDGTRSRPEDTERPASATATASDRPARPTTASQDDDAPASEARPELDPKDGTSATSAALFPVAAPSPIVGPLPTAVPQDPAATPQPSSVGTDGSAVLPPKVVSADPVDHTSDPDAAPAGEAETASVTASLPGDGALVQPEISAVPAWTPGLVPETAATAAAALAGADGVAVGGIGTAKSSGRRDVAASAPATTAAVGTGGPPPPGVPESQVPTGGAVAATRTEPGAKSDAPPAEAREASKPAASEAAPQPAALDALLPRAAADIQPTASSALPPVSAPSPALPSPAVSTTGTHPVVSNVALSAVPVEIGMKGLAGISRFDIRLAPEDLGRVDVRLDIAEDGRVRAHLTVDRPETLAWLHRETGQLERALGQAGLQTDGDFVGFSLRDPGTGGDGQRAGDGNGRERADTSARADAVEVDEGTIVMPSRRTAWGRTSGIDRRI